MFGKLFVYTLHLKGDQTKDFFHRLSVIFAFSRPLIENGLFIAFSTFDGFKQKLRIILSQNEMISLRLIRVGVQLENWIHRYLQVVAYPSMIEPLRNAENFSEFEHSNKMIDGFCKVYIEPRSTIANWQSDLTTYLMPSALVIALDETWDWIAVRFHHSRNIVCM